jgi:glucose dehydrogenase
MQHGEPPWPAWKNYPQLLGHGLITFGGMLYYSAPGLALAYVSWALRSRTAAVAAAGLLVAATIAIPGYMSHYCRELLFTSVWFWQVAGFSFASVFTRRFGLDSDAAPDRRMQRT